jgi:hypothetical protein
MIDPSRFPNGRMEGDLNMNHEESKTAVKTTASINLLAGLWFFVSPWVYAFYALPTAWNSWIIGAMIVVFAAIRLYSPMTRGASVVNLLLGGLTFLSPWIYGYTGDTRRFGNSLCVGVVVFVLSIFGSSVGMGHPTPPQRLGTS